MGEYREEWLLGNDLFFKGSVSSTATLTLRTKLQITSRLRLSRSEPNCKSQVGCFILPVPICKLTVPTPFLWVCFANHERSSMKHPMCMMDAALSLSLWSSGPTPTSYAYQGYSPDPPRARSSSRQGRSLCLPYAEEVAGVPAAHVGHQP
jgi:hypothetical protein